MIFGLRYRKDTLSKSIKNILGFYPKNVNLYQLAFRHRSVSKKLANGYRQNNERLEFLGDTVLSTVVADFLYSKYPLATEGFLTEMRSKIVSRNSLNKVASELGLSKLIQKESHRILYKSVEGDALEALIGAIYLDKGYAFTKKIIVHNIIKQHINVEELESKQWNYKSKLIDLSQKNRQKISFEVIDIIGNGYQKKYKVSVSLDGDVKGEGMGHSIKAAEQAASEQAFEAIGKNG